MAKTEWQRFETFSDRFVLCAQRACLTHNVQRANTDAPIEKWINLERTEFTQDMALPRGTRVMVLRKSDYDLRHAIPDAIDSALGEIDALKAIENFPADAPPAACATWWLYFRPSPAAQGFGWDFERAEVQIGSREKTASDATAWVHETLAGVGETKLVRGPNFFQYDTSADASSLLLTFYSREIYQIFRQWTKKGAPLAEVTFGLAHAYGHGVPQDDVLAAQWYGKAAQKGHALAQILLGLCHAAGKGVSHDPAQAVWLFRRAAAHGKAHALYLLGNIFEGGIGTDADPGRAWQCYLAAARLGSAVAEYRLGVLRASQTHVLADHGEACRWLVNAAVHGCDKALDELFSIQRKVPAVQYAWPMAGEQRTRMAAFLKNRTSRRDEQDMMETVLSIADMFDAAIARGELSDQERDGIVEGASSPFALLWDPTTSLIVKAQDAGLDMSSVLRQLFDSRSERARVMAVRCINDMKNKPGIADDILTLARTDKSAKVREWLPRDSRQA